MKPVLLLALIGFSSAAVCPTGAVYDSNFNKCYLYVKQSSAFLAAEQYCAAQGGHLLSISNAFENSAVRQSASTNLGADFWIGANKMMTSSWSWTDGSSMAYSGWASGQPGASSPCGGVSVSSGQWSVADCSTSRPFVCGVPFAGTKPSCQSSLNIPANPPVSTSNNQTYQSYTNGQAYFLYSLNLKADPCNDFYAYACGNYKKQISFYYADSANLESMVNQLTSPAYQTTIKSSTALTKEQLFFNECVRMNSNPTIYNNTLASKNLLGQQVQTLTGLLGSKFTVVYGGTPTLPTPKQLGAALGYLSFTQGIDTYVSPYVDTFWPDNTKGYAMFIDQNTAELSKTYYAPQAWATIYQSYLNEVVGVFMQYCLSQGISCSQSSLTQSATRLLAFEQNLALNYSTSDDIRRQSQRSWNPTTIAAMQSQYPFIDWTTYYQYIPSVAQSVVTASNFQMSVMETSMTSKLSQDILSGKLAATDVVNYLFMRLLLDNSVYMPMEGSSFIGELQRTTGQIGLKKRSKAAPRRRDVTDVQLNCMDYANNYLMFANGRVFVDYMYPTQASRDAIRTAAGGLIKNIINSFQGMLEQLDWMDADTQRKALDKTNGILKNIAYPDWITVNAQLDAYHSALNIVSGQDYFDMLMMLTQFNLYVEYKELTASTTDRTDFLGQPGTVNAWYQPELNSITFPAGILVPPYFDPNWPASMNYGGLGVVAGHELTHGFDDEGVQWGPTGNLNAWMDLNSTSGFNNMAQCVISEYSGFCPLNGTSYHPQCINGAQTQGENIADNGGIHSAFRAYRVHTNLNGPDPTLPDPVLGGLTHDQIFFLSFAQVWCQAPSPDSAIYRQLMVDPHSPSKYRVFGTIQNFPAFQTAYNCPANSVYAPTNHCKVWVPNFEA